MNSEESLQLNLEGFGDTAKEKVDDDKNVTEQAVEISKALSSVIELLKGDLFKSIERYIEYHLSQALVSNISYPLKDQNDTLQDIRSNLVTLQDELSGLTRLVEESINQIKEMQETEIDRQNEKFRMLTEEINESLKNLLDSQKIASSKGQDSLGSEQILTWFKTILSSATTGILFGKRITWIQTSIYQILLSVFISITLVGFSLGVYLRYLSIDQKLGGLLKQCETRVRQR